MDDNDVFYNFNYRTRNKKKPPTPTTYLALQGREFALSEDRKSILTKDIKTGKMKYYCSAETFDDPDTIIALVNGCSVEEWKASRERFANGLTE